MVWLAEENLVQRRTYDHHVEYDHDKTFGPVGLGVYIRIFHKLVRALQASWRGLCDVPAVT